jgi:hypothetical protein
VKKKIEERVQTKTETKIFHHNKKLNYRRWKDTKMCVSSGDGTRMSKENHVLAVVLIGQLM